MIKYFSFLLLMLTASALLPGQQSFYDFTVTDINGNEYPLAQLQGQKVLVVNTASECALTPQYEGLERLFQKYGGEDFVILGFPSNDFAEEEPGTNQEIAEFCSREYGVTFPMMAKITVKGDQMHPLYRWLTEASENGVEESRVSWNFQKYMIDEHGSLVGHVAPVKKPECRKILRWLRRS